MSYDQSSFQVILDQFNRRFNMSFGEHELSSFELSWGRLDNPYRAVLDATIENLQHIPSTEITFTLKQTDLSITITKPSNL